MRAPCQLHHHPIEKQKFSSEKGGPHQINLPSTESPVYISASTKAFWSQLSTYRPQAGSEPGPEGCEARSPCPCRVSSPAGDQVQKPRALLHKVGTSDHSVHRALRELTGEKRPWLGRGKSRKVNLNGLLSKSAGKAGKGWVRRPSLQAGCSMGPAAPLSCLLLYPLPQKVPDT